jgi:hypothetical protein
LSAAAFADEVTFNTAATTGCFTTGSSCTQSTSATWDPSGNNNTVTFTGIDTNSATSSGGSLAINLGTITWQKNATQIGNNENFYATVIFTLPTGIAGGQSALFSADITGIVQSGPDDVAFNFNHNSNDPLVATFNNGSAIGSFNFYVDDVTVNGNSSATWTGHVVDASQSPIHQDPPPGQTPEPGTMVLMGSGLLTMAGLLRHKLRR